MADDDWLLVDLLNDDRSLYVLRVSYWVAYGLSLNELLVLEVTFGVDIVGTVKVCVLQIVLVVVVVTVQVGSAGNSSSSSV
jgi:hypothetical protein